MGMKPWPRLSTHEKIELYNKVEKLKLTLAINEAEHKIWLSGQLLSLAKQATQRELNRLKEQVRAQNTKESKINHMLRNMGVGTPLQAFDDIDRALNTRKVSSKDCKMLNSFAESRLFQSNDPILVVVE